MNNMWYLDELKRKDNKIAELEDYKRLFKEGKINHLENPHKKVVKIKGEILGAQSAYDHSIQIGLGNISVSTGLIIDLVVYAEQSDNKIAELEDKLKIVTNILDSGYDIEVGSNTHHKLKGHKDDD